MPVLVTARTLDPQSKSELCVQRADTTNDYCRFHELAEIPSLSAPNGFLAQFSSSTQRGGHSCLATETGTCAWWEVPQTLFKDRVWWPFMFDHRDKYPCLCRKVAISEQQCSLDYPNFSASPTEQEVLLNSPCSRLASRSNSVMWVFVSGIMIIFFSPVRDVGAAALPCPSGQTMTQFATLVGCTSR